MLLNVEERLRKANDPGFRNRAVIEYKSIMASVGQRLVLDGAKILDFGCGHGIAAASFALRHVTAKVHAFDVVPPRDAALLEAYRSQVDLPLPPNLYVVTDDQLDEGNYDLIYCWSVLEHIRRPLLPVVLKRIRNLLKPGGILFINSEPLFYSPRGHHLYNYDQAPWFHLHSSEEEIRNCVLRGTAREKELREWNQYLCLNKITAFELDEILSSYFTVLKRKTVAATDAPPIELTKIYSIEVLTTTAAQFLVQVPFEEIKA